MNYATLQAQVADWMHRVDLTSAIPSFIELAEEQINRTLRVRQMEVVLPATAIANNIITPNPDVVDVKELWLSGQANNEIKPQSLKTVVVDKTYSLPTLYAWQGLNLYFNGAGSVEGVLYERVPAIATANSNWLSENHPSVYLWGALMFAKMYIEADHSFAEAKFLKAMDEVSGNDQRRFGSLVARAR